MSDPKQYPTLDSLEVIRVIDESLFKEYPYKLFLKQNHKIFEVAVVIFVMFQVIASVFITMCEGGGLYTVFHHGLNLSEFIHRIIVLLLRILARAVTPWIFYRQLCSMSDSEKALNNKKKKDDYRSPEFKLPHKSVKRLQHNTMESTVSHAILFSIILVFLGAFVTVDSHLKGKSICIKELLQIQIPLVGMQVFAFLDSLATSFILILVGLIKDSYCIENRFCTEYNCEYFAVIRKRWTRLDIFCYIMSSLLILFSVISLFSNRSLTTVPDQQLSSNEFEIWYFWIIVLSLLLFVGSSSNWTAKVIAITGNVLALCCAFCFTLFLGVTKVTFPPGTTIVLVYSYLSATTINFLFCLLKTHYRHKKMKSKHFWLCLLIYVLLSVTFCIVFVREFIFCASFVEWP